MTAQNPMITKPGPLVDELPVAFVYPESRGWVATWRVPGYDRVFRDYYTTKDAARAVVPKFVQKIVEGRNYD